MTEDHPEEEDPTRELGAQVRRRVRVGVGLGLATVVGLGAFTALPLLDVVALSVFGILLPALAVAQLPLIEFERIERIQVYVGSAVTILAMGLVAGLLALRLDGIAPADLRHLPTDELLLWTGGVTAAGLLIAGLFQPLDRWIGGGRPDFMRRLLPRTSRERGVFAGLSFSAGVGEELAYRAYVYQAIQLLGPGPWAAALLATVPFAVLHAYQGGVGMVRTAAMGFVLAVPVVLTGSLLPSMAAHALIDILMGIVIGPRLLGGEPGEGEAGEGQPGDGEREETEPENDERVAEAPEPPE